MIAEWEGQWRGRGYGYWLAEDRDGRVVGLAGLRPAEGYANVAYRFAVAVQGRGLAKEAVRAALAVGTEWLDVPLRALVSEVNTPSVATALACGLERVGRERHRDQSPQEEPATVFQAPWVEGVTAFDEATYAEALDLWCRVNDAGGAVGFLPGAPRARVSEALDAHVAQLADGSAVACLLRAPGPLPETPGPLPETPGPLPETPGPLPGTPSPGAAPGGAPTPGPLRGIGWWVQGPNPLLGHTRTAYRVMTDPDHRGRGLGTILLAGMHRVARADGVDLAILEYRSGTGVGAFYATAGYTEVGRVPRAIRVAPGDERDSVVMVRRLDGAPPGPEGGF